MRILLKGLLLLAVMVGIQCLINGSASGGALDEAQFTARVFVANLQGVADNNESLVDAADALRRRQEERAQRLHPSMWRAEPVADASFESSRDVG